MTPEEHVAILSQTPVHTYAIRNLVYGVACIVPDEHSLGSKALQIALRLHEALIVRTLSPKRMRPSVQKKAGAWHNTARELYSHVGHSVT